MTNNTIKKHAKFDMKLTPTGQTLFDLHIKRSRRHGLNWPIEAMVYIDSLAKGWTLRLTCVESFVWFMFFQHYPAGIQKSKVVLPDAKKDRYDELWQEFNSMSSDIVKMAHIIYDIFGEKK